ncbi:MAG: hypothetical protein H7A35_09325 [Planctomycetales bacterium]|nr:hypothetical protein [bacterium]UNM07079.1 MAG: hypothetical protein H7A35_09325 [Planctomycetales bacterium]
MNAHKSDEQDQLKLASLVKFNLQTLDCFEPFIGATVTRLGIHRWPQLDWDIDSADGDLVISLQLDGVSTDLRIEARMGTPGGVLVEQVPHGSELLQFRNLVEARLRYEQEQQEDKDGNVAGSRPQTINLAGYAEFAAYIGARLERIGLACTRRSGWEMFPLGLLLDFSGGLQLYVTIGEDGTEVYRGLTRKYENDALVMMTFDSSTKWMSGSGGQTKV